MRRFGAFSLVIGLLLAAAAWIGWTAAQPGGRRADAVLVPPASGAPPVQEPDAVNALAQVPSPARENPLEAQNALLVGEARDEPALAPGILDILVVRVDTGEPVPEALLALGPGAAPGGRFPPLMSTDESGRARCEVPIGQPSTLLASAGELYSSEVTRIPKLAPGEIRSVVLRLRSEREWRFHGRVVAFEGREGLAGAHVVRPRISSPAAGDRAQSVAEGDALVVARSDSEGRFHVVERSLDPSTLEIRAVGYSPLRFRIGDGHETPARARELWLQRTARLAVRVADADREPLQIVLTTSPFFASAPEDGLTDGRVLVWRATLDPGGSCTLEDLRAQVPLTLEIYREQELLRRAPRALTLQPGETREFTWSLSGSRLRGRVLGEDGSAVTERELWLLRRDGHSDSEQRSFQSHERRLIAASTRTDEAGRFVLEDVAPGEYWLGPAWVSASAAGRGVLPIAAAVQVPPDAGEVLVELHVPPPLFVDGLVQGHDDRPAQNIQVVAVSRSIWAFSALGTTDAEGRFRLGPMPPGEYRLNAYGSYASTPGPVSVAAGARDVLLRLSEHGSLSGRTLDAETGAPTPALCWILSLVDAPPHVSRTADGRFHFTLRPDSYILLATATGGRIGVRSPIIVESGESIDDLAVYLERGALLRVRSSGETRDSSIRIRWSGYAILHSGLRPGVAAEQTVPAGEIEVELFQDRQLLEARHLTVSVGEEVEVVFER